MAAELENLLDLYRRGLLDRRQLLMGATTLIISGALDGAFETQAQEAPLAPAMSINHVNVGIKDTKRSAEFYSALLGARPQASSPGGVDTMYFPGAKPGSGMWISMSKPPANPDVRKGSDAWDGTPGIYTHIGFGVKVPTSEFPRIAAEVKKRFPDVKQPNLFKTEAAGQECMIFDPDGTPIQLIQIEHNGTLSGYSKETGLKNAPPLPDKAVGEKAPPTGLAPATSLNHVNIGVKDLKRSAEFYAFLFGAKPKASIGQVIQTMYLPGAHEGYGSWLSLTTGGGASRQGVDGWDGKPGVYTHVGYGVTIPTKEFPRIAEDIKKRFPDIKQPNLFKSEAAGQEIMIFDPDGTPIQLIQVEHQGTLTGFNKETGEKIK